MFTMLSSSTAVQLRQVEDEVGDRETSGVPSAACTSGRLEQHRARPATAGRARAGASRSRARGARCRGRAPKPSSRPAPGKREVPVRRDERPAADRHERRPSSDQEAHPNLAARSVVRRSIHLITSSSRLLVVPCHASSRPPRRRPTASTQASMKSSSSPRRGRRTSSPRSGSRRASRARPPRARASSRSVERRSPSTRSTPRDGLLVAARDDPLAHLGDELREAVAVLLDDFISGMLLRELGERPARRPASAPRAGRRAAASRSRADHLDLAHVALDRRPRAPPPCCGSACRGRPRAARARPPASISPTVVPRKPRSANSRMASVTIRSRVLGSRCVR